MKDKINKEFSLYPELPEQAHVEAQNLINKFKAQMLIECEGTLNTLYCHVTEYIENDSWTNFRNELLDGLRDYPNAKIHEKYNFEQIRTKMLEEHREEIINDLHQDMIKEIEDLKEKINYLEKESRRN